MANNVLQEQTTPISPAIGAAIDTSRTDLCSSIFTGQLFLSINYSLPHVQYLSTPIGPDSLDEYSPERISKMNHRDL